MKFAKVPGDQLSRMQFNNPLYKLAAAWETEDQRYLIRTSRPFKTVTYGPYIHAVDVRMCVDRDFDYIVGDTTKFTNRSASCQDAAVVPFVVTELMALVITHDGGGYSVGSVLFKAICRMKGKHTHNRVTVNSFQHYLDNARGERV